MELKQFSKESSNIKNVFNTFKFESLSATNDNVTFGLKSDMIYTFLPAGCITRYVNLQKQFYQD